MVLLRSEDARITHGVAVIAFGKEDAYCGESGLGVVAEYAVNVVAGHAFGLRLDHIGPCHGCDGLRVKVDGMV